ncbi:class I SAM-dependent methyltransferase [soil metagenome]
MDAERYRQGAREQWSRSAAGWARRRETLQRAALPVSEWLVKAIAPAPGQTVVELAAGPGDTGLLAARLIEPGGTLICSDFAEEMVEAARDRARELGVGNGEFRVLEMEWLDLETASVDAVLCRWGFMLTADPGAALREARRVLRPGGRVALAAWDAPEANPWAALPNAELVERGLAEPRDLGKPGMFSFSPPGHIEALLSGAGFVETVVDAVDFEQRYPSAEDFWTVSLDLARPLADAMEGLPEPERASFREAVERRLAPFEREGEYIFPARTLVAAASA